MQDFEEMPEEEAVRFFGEVYGLFARLWIRKAEGTTFMTVFFLLEVNASAKQELISG